jgi:hypothetical protein
MKHPIGEIVAATVVATVELSNLDVEAKKRLSKEALATIAYILQDHLGEVPLFDPAGVKGIENIKKLLDEAGIDHQHLYTSMGGDDFEFLSKIYKKIPGEKTKSKAQKKRAR